jgi:hypothetical protein
VVVDISVKQLSVKVPVLHTAAQDDIKTTTSSPIDHPVQYTVNFFLLKKINYNILVILYRLDLLVEEIVVPTDNQ